MLQINNRILLSAVLVVALGSGRASAGELAMGSQGLPFSFEQNVGQSDPRVSFLSRGHGYTLFLTPGGAVIDLGTAAPRAVVGLKLVGANPHPEVAGASPLAAVSHYYGREGDPAWVGHAPHYASVRYGQVYPGVALVFHGSPGRLEYDFLLAPSADLRAVELAFEGAERIAIGPAGELVLHTTAGRIIQPPPAVYEDLGGRRRALAGRFVLRGERRIGFTVDSRDPRARLVIDPVVIYSSYLGGKPGGGGYTSGKRDGADFAVDCAVDAAGNVYMTGVTSSPDFPTAGALYSHVDGFNPWIGKLSPDGRLIYATYLPGTRGVVDRAGFNGGTGVAVDAAGNAYVAGLTQSTALPVTPDALQKKYNGGLTDSFVVELDPQGKLVYLSYLGGNGFDTVSCEALDAAGNFYVSGATSSDDFPVAKPLQAKRKAGGTVFGGLDVFVAKFQAGLKKLTYSTFLGGGGDEATSGLAVDASGAVLVTGWTGSTDFPLVNPFQAAHKGGVNTRSFNIPTDIFVAKLSPDGSALRYSTFLGGSGPEYPDPDNFTRRIAVDKDGSAYVISDTASADFPVTENALQKTFGGGPSDAFLTKLNSTGGLVYSTYLGGSGGERGRSIALDSGGNIYIAGQTFSANFPVLHPVQEKLRGDADAFLIKLNPAGTALLFSTYLGGDGADGALGVAVRAPDEVYIAGSSFSGNFPVTPNALQTKFGGLEDAFVTRLDLGPSSQVYFLSLAKGLNLISLPVQPPGPFTARSLAARLGATIVIAFDERQQRFVGFTPADAGDGFLIEGGKGYFVMVPEAKQISLVGAPWNSADRLHAAAPLVPADAPLADVLARLQLELERLVKRE